MNYRLRIALINEQDVVILHEIAIEQFGGLAGIRNIALLQSAINQPIMMIEFGNEEDQSMHSLASAYLFHIIKNHPFADGNKRTGILTTVEFLSRNGFELNMTDDVLYQLALDTAASKINQEAIKHCLQQSIQPIEK